MRTRQRLTCACHRASRPPLRLRSLRFVHAAPGEDAYLLEAVAARGGSPGLAVLPPLHVRGADGHYSMEVATRIAGAALREPPSRTAVDAVRAKCVRTPSAGEEAEAEDGAAAGAAGEDGVAQRRATSAQDIAFILE